MLMHDYSQLGQEKLRQQTCHGLDEIRCPLDGAIMMVTGGTACKKEGGKPVYREFTGHPRKSAWTITKIHLECSACRRSMHDVAVERAQADTQSPTFHPVLS